jgi:phosphoglycolate/pyridoxal phosphate phosphatase family enzyme
MTHVAFDGLVCDLDGVIYSGDRAVPGAPEAIRELRARGVRIVFCTNNSRSTVAEYRSKLARLGIDTSTDEIVTSGVVTAEVLAGRGHAGHSAFVIGREGVRSALREVGIRIAEPKEPADLVVVGFDDKFDYEGMKQASLAVRRGAKLIATNDDAALPMPEGLWPGAGAILASIETASGATAEVMGKPHAPMMDAVARRLKGCTRIAMVGDRPETDLVGGAARGWTTILVTSGVTPPDEAEHVSPRPDLVVRDLSALAALLAHT